MIKKHIFPQGEGHFFLLLKPFFIILFFLFPMGNVFGAALESSPQKAVRLGSSGLPLPRFVSIKSVRMNARVGPGRNYPVSWLYERRGLPVEIVQEYENWRKIRDSKGEGGWVYQPLLSGKRTVMVAPWRERRTDTAILRKDPYETSNFVSLVEPGTIANVLRCTGEWCYLDFKEAQGWLKQDQLWGVYPGEVID